MAVTAWILAAFYVLSGAAMIVAPAEWYAATPGVTATGPFNHHFVIDVGLAFAGSGAMIGWGVSGGGWRLVAAGAMFPTLHALFHVVESFTGHPPTHLLMDVVAIYMPAILTNFVALRLRSSAA